MGIMLYNSENQPFSYLAMGNDSEQIKVAGLDPEKVTDVSIEIAACQLIEDVDASKSGNVLLVTIPGELISYGFPLLLHIGIQDEGPNSVTTVTVGIPVYAETIISGGCGSGAAGSACDISYSSGAKCPLSSTVYELTRLVDGNSDDINRLYDTVARISSSGNATYVYDQTTAASTWVIQHNLGRYPDVAIIDQSGDTVLADYVYTDTNTVTVSFSEAMMGKALLV